MNAELDALALRIARELARADLAPVAAASEGAGGPPHMEVGSAEDGAAYRNHAGGHDRVPAIAAPAGVSFVRENARIADFIDHTLLKAEATRRDVEQLCAEAMEHRFAAVCVNPAWVTVCAERLRDSGVAIATVIGFPLGANRSETKAFEARIAVEQGATELDMVAAIGHIKGGEWGYVADDISAVVAAARGTLVKVILETAALTPVEVIKSSALAREAGAHYVKTSTGFHPAGGATAEAVALMRLVVGDAMGVKASGGVRDCAAALKMIANGATRIGTSSGVAMAQCLGRGPLPLGELLTSAHEHGATCLTCSAPSTAPVPPSAGPY